MGTGRRITVIGAGPGGYVAAIRAAQLGAQVSLIEDQEVGGACLNRGCIPSKALLFNAEVAGLLKRAADFGLTFPGELTLDVNRMVERKRRIVQSQVRGIQALLKSWGVSLIRGRGRLTGPRSIEVTEPGGTARRIEADRVILATGSMPLRPELFPFDGDTIITSEEALEPRGIPKNLLIVGAGIEGCEFAFMYRELGAAVTLVELKDRPLATEDEEISDLILREMKRRKMEIHLATRVEKVSVADTRVEIKLSGGRNLTVDRVLVSVGRRMNTEGLGLEAAGVPVGSRGEIRVNEQ
ncbi:MAG TPA: NAD(P)/FAD-dependent oxidoreductase, partial [Nitrospiria bacterium]